MFIARGCGGGELWALVWRGRAEKGHGNSEHSRTQSPGFDHSVPEQLVGVKGRGEGGGSKQSLLPFFEYTRAGINQVEFTRGYM